ncbi:ectoine hydroxylase [Microbacterium pseudoresistens]|uniref:Ectoine hydroxylase n=1 Tax=Microbacterium pseudoresistens TaxID=640634 RepID=A0A7Y9JN00_9MICO|nr:ectoine hydroxylase [Microbacterium pseudoresistens]NYD54038.1 ectoine hydroxylase [Microbacterium pseudoresistens]
MTNDTTTAEDLFPTRVDEVRDNIARSQPAVWGSAETGPFSAGELEAHDARGYTVLDDFITPEEVRAFSAELDRLAADSALSGDPRLITERTTGAVRSVFEVERLSEVIDALSRSPKVLDRARQILGSEVYLHQTRINYMPSFTGTGFYWHSDFETWHAEDGMPIPRAVSLSIALTDNYPFNGGLMVMPGSHRTFVPAVGATPENNHEESLKAQEAGVPSHEAITELAEQYGIDQFTGAAGSALWFDSNIMHGSGNNITPYPRSNVFMVFNSVDNALVEPFAAKAPRPSHIANRDFTPLR